MIDLCNDVLDVTKLKSGKTNVEPAWCDLPSLLKAQCESFALHAATLGIKLEYHGDPNLPHQLYVDNLRWRQCLTNLLTNACRFTKNGGQVDVYFICLADASLSPDYVRLRFEVADTGIGKYLLVF